MPGRPRGLFLAITAASLMTQAAGCTATSTPQANPGGSKSIMTATAGKARFGAGEPVVVTVTVTSREKAACRMAGVPDGVVTIASVTRDGAPVVPALSEGQYIDGFNAVITGNSVSVDPGKAVSMALTSESPDTAAAGSAAVLTSSVQAGNDGASIARWPVGRPGTYVVDLAYRMPPVKLPSAACAVSADPVSVSFAVAGS